MPTGSPVYQRVAPDGTVTADFEGRVSAYGLDLPLKEYTGGTIDDPVETRAAIVWLPEEGSTTTYAPYILSETNDQSPVVRYNRTRIRTPNPSYKAIGNRPTDVELELGGEYYKGSGAVGTYAYIRAGGQSGGSLHASQALILNNNGESSFLKLQSAANRAIQWGTSSVTFSASTGASTLVSHGLGRVPVFAAAVPIMAPGQFLFPSVRSGGITSSSVLFAFNSTVAITGTFQFLWMVIG